MDKCRLELIGITYNQIESGVYAVILQEADGTRRIPIIIGYPEAQSIECKLQEVVTPRPLTHDLMANMLNEFGVTLLEVNINKLPNGVFAAELLMSGGTYIYDPTGDRRGRLRTRLADRPTQDSEKQKRRHETRKEPEAGSRPHRRPESSHATRRRS